MTSRDVTHELVHSEMGGMRGSGTEDHRRDTTPERLDAFSQTDGTEVLRERRQRCSHRSADRSTGATSKGGGGENLHAGLIVSSKAWLKKLTLIESTGKMAACSEIPAWTVSNGERAESAGANQDGARLRHRSGDTHHSSRCHVDTPSIARGEGLILVFVVLEVGKVVGDLALHRMVDVRSVRGHVEAARRA